VTWIKGVKDNLLEKMHFDVLIADYHLNAGETGTACVKALKQQGATFDVTLLITANRSNEIREEAASLGMAYLPKPTKPAALKRLLKQGLG
jgi:CheY-like chemotaxis protein